MAGLKMLTAKQKEVLFGTGLMVMRMPIPAPPPAEDFRWILEPGANVELSDLKWYIDASLIDPRTPFRRLGAGFVGVLRGAPVALANALPPPLVDTIPGAEAWALYVILSMCHSLPSVVTDCLGNRLTLLEGREAATNAQRPLARVWTAIFSCCEDALLQHLDAMLTWGPAHTSWASLGSRLRSDGKPLTATDWRANGIADGAAKMAAYSVRPRVPLENSMRNSARHINTELR